MVALRMAPLAGAVSALTGLVTIWIARSTVPHWIYVSELGAQGAPTAPAFAVALLAIAFGGAAIAVGSSAFRAVNRVLGAWPVAVTIAASAVCFVVASQVTCTATCPVPLVNPRAQPQDLIHIAFAVLGFGLGCWAMLQCAFVRAHRAVRRISLVACGTVAVITIVGGVLAIFHVAVDLGAFSEFAGMTVAIGWLATFGVWLAFAPRRRQPPARARSQPSASPRAMSGRFAIHKPMRTSNTTTLVTVSVQIMPVGPRRAGSGAEHHHGQAASMNASGLTS